MLHNSLIISFFAPFSLLQIFTESLICSGSIDNISLATEALTVMSGSSQVSLSPPSPSFSHILPYQLSLDVAVKAAQECFNSAAGPRDPEIELTRYNFSIIIKNGIILYLTQLKHPPNYCPSTWLQ